MNDMQRLRRATTPSAISITTPSVIIALLSATIGIGIVGREQLRLQRGVAGLQHLAQRADAEALSEPASSDSFGANTPSTSTSRRTPSTACSFSGRRRALQRRRIRRRRQRQHFAHQRAQIGVFPVLDPPVRQAQRAHRPRSAARARSATLPVPGSRSRATAKLSLSARAPSRSLPMPRSSQIRLAQAASSNWA